MNRIIKSELWENSALYAMHPEKPRPSPCGVWATFPTGFYTIHVEIQELDEDGEYRPLQRPTYRHEDEIKDEAEALRRIKDAEKELREYL